MAGNCVKSTIDRVCETCEELKEAQDFQYSYSKDCKPCFNTKATADRNASNVDDLSLQQLAQSLWPTPRLRKS